ncbi:MAG: 4-hydroxybenzoate 3-monooxygenase [Pseudomonadota bacterium]
MTVTRTQVAIVGGGPSGLLLSLLLEREGIDTIVVERQTRDHVLSRIRAGVLERGLVDLLRHLGIAGRLEAEGLVHDGTVLAYDNDRVRIDFAAFVEHTVTVYGQTEVTKDLYDERDRIDRPVVHGAEGVVLHGLDTDAPHLTYQKNGTEHRIDADWIAGCDGFHGVSRRAIPDTVRTEYEKVYPFGWLGILSETPPVHHELIYANSERGFALCSMRNPRLSRYYIQCAVTDDPGNWSDDRFWDELRARIPDEDAEALVTGPSIEKSIAPLRSFVTEPMRWGRLFLCGDAAHIVPPTGAKGLNTAASDVHYLWQALARFYAEGDREGIERYSEQALARVWKVERFSWWMTALLHRFPDQEPFDLKMQKAELAFLRDTPAAQDALARNYVGLPY